MWRYDSLYPDDLHHHEHNFTRIMRPPLGTFLTRRELPDLYPDDFYHLWKVALLGVKGI